jgi:aryl-alcohol dehydrogenase-like predicted oxidoreductase
VSLAALVSGSKRTRRRACRDLAASPALAFALRRVLFTDRNAEVRAAAARRLGELPADDAQVEGWLVDALGDRSPLVRDAILRALAKVAVPVVTTGETPRIAGAADAVRALVETDRLWWVRRTAVYALAALGGATEVPAFKAALADPFWRVRHAAVKVLAVLGARDLDVRDEVIAAPPTPTLAYLRASWGPVAVEAPARAAQGTSQLPAALLDPDPAVVTARLASASCTPVAMVELLCDPHAPLRLLAAERILASNDREAFVAALDWLEEPRIPHVADTVEKLLDQLGDTAGELARLAFERSLGGTRAGAARWAIAWTVATRSEQLYELAIECARRDARLRRAAIPIAPIADLVAWTSDLALVDAIATELHERRAAAAHDALLALDATHHAIAYTLQIEVAARRDHWDRVAPALADAHHGPRAIAARWLARTGRLAAADATRLAADTDPAVREAIAVAVRDDDELVATLVRDADPWVARTAIERLVASHGHRRELPEHVVAAALHAHRADDAWLRAHACLLPVVTPALLAATIEAFADRDDMVRSAALDALERTPDVDTRLAALAGVGETATRMIHAWLHGDMLPGREEPHVEAGADHAAGAAAAHTARVEQRAFGRAGFSVAPLAISGAFDLSPRALRIAADAGVNLWFWEPAYDTLTRFLRERGDHVIAGSYHADAASIEADVDRALRALHRDALDVLLLFWSRSAARVDAGAYAAIEHLKASGKVRALGFSTHHRGLARTAIETSPWDVVMIRHSAAHPGIETELLPAARERGTAIVTFSALCYGRMVSGPDAPSAADCYRYSLSQPGVTACISAPRRRSELVENVGVLAQPVLDAAQLAAMREHGRLVRAEDQRFNTLLRQPTRDAAAAARELLAAELPPSDEVQARPLPRPSQSRPARTNLGKTRTRK